MGELFFAEMFENSHIENERGFGAVREISPGSALLLPCAVSGSAVLEKTTCCEFLRSLLALTMNQRASRLHRAYLALVVLCSIVIAALF